MVNTTPNISSMQPMSDGTNDQDKATSETVCVAITIA